MSRSLSRQGRYGVVWLGIEVLGQLKRGMKTCHGLFYIFEKYQHTFRLITAFE